MSYQTKICSLGHKHDVQYCDSCGCELFLKDRYTVQVGHQHATANLIAWCTLCAAKSPIARTFLKVPGHNHDALRDLLGDPPDPRRRREG